VVVGIVTQIVPDFIAEGELATKVVLEPTEIISGKPLNNNRVVEGWTSGGSYLRTPTGNIPYRPSEFASSFDVGRSYFVSLTFDHGRYWLSPRVATALLEGGSAATTRPARRRPDESPQHPLPGPRRSHRRNRCCVNGPSDSTSAQGTAHPRDSRSARARLCGRSRRARPACAAGAGRCRGA
jgi:hypothetical protein